MYPPRQSASNDPHGESLQAHWAECTSRTGSAESPVLQPVKPQGLLLLSSLLQLKLVLFSQLPLEKEGHWRLNRFAENILPAFFPVRRDRARLRRGRIRSKTEAPGKNSKSEHMKGVAHQQCALESLDLEHARNRPH